LSRGWSIEDLLAEQELDGTPPATIATYLAIPQATNTDRGKSAIALPPECATAIVEAVERVTRDWRRAREKEERDRHRSWRLAEQQKESEEKVARQLQRQAEGIDRAARAEVRRANTGSSAPACSTRRSRRQQKLRASR
jgi:DNA topoisomerase VI subunit B